PPRSSRVCVARAASLSYNTPLSIFIGPTNSSALKETAMARLLPPTSNLLAIVLLCMSVPVLAVDRTFQIEIENNLKGTVPSNWWLRASWRDQTLVVFVSPSAQQSFDLWYDFRESPRS